MKSFASSSLALSSLLSLVLLSVLLGPLVSTAYAAEKKTFIAIHTAPPMTDEQFKQAREGIIKTSKEKGVEGIRYYLDPQSRKMVCIFRAETADAVSEVFKAMNIPLTDGGVFPAKSGTLRK